MGRWALMGETWGHRGRVGKEGRSPLCGQGVARELRGEGCWLPQAAELSLLLGETLVPHSGP